jgi:YbbR domain-containing protein
MKRLLNNWPFKILSLILSLILWLYVTGELERGLWWTNREVAFDDIPIKVMGLPGNEFKVDISPHKANVVLYSYKSNVENINSENVTLFVNLSNLKSGIYELYIQNIIPKEFNIGEITPSTVMVTIQEKLNTKPLTPSIP